MVKISIVFTQDDTLLQAENNYELRLMLKCSFIYLFLNHVESNCSPAELEIGKSEAKTGRACAASLPVYFQKAIPFMSSDSSL